MLIGYGIGLSGEFFGVWQLMKNDFDIIYSFIIGYNYNYIFSFFVAIGHIALIILLCKSGIFTWLKKSLAAVGRMALTNYILQGALLIPIFFGFGFGLFAKFDRTELLGFLVAVWIIQLIISPLWLKHYHFGPMEWLWRSLTYWKIQPMRK